MFVCVQYNEEMGQSPPVNDASFTPHNQPSLPRFNGQVSYVVCVVCLSIWASSSLYAGVRIWLSLTDCYRQTCVSCSRAGIVFTYWSKNCFFALLGRHVAPINVKYWRSGAGHSFLWTTWIFRHGQIFTKISIFGNFGDREPIFLMQQCKKLAWLWGPGTASHAKFCKSHLTGHTPLRKIYTRN